MEVGHKRKYSLIKKIGLFFVIFLIVAIGAIWFVFNQKFSDTAEISPDYTLTALELIHEFEKNDSLANRKYAEKIIVVSGEVSAVESLDSTVNIKMADSTTGSYVIFAFQQQYLGQAKDIKLGEKVSIKGSCSGGAYSEILETEFITFKRCAINN
jgi:hypothetical protein